MLCACVHVLRVLWCDTYLIEEAKALSIHVHRFDHNRVLIVDGTQTRTCVFVCGEEGWVYI